METKNKTAQSVYPAVRYTDARAAIDWLKSALGFQERVTYGDDAGGVVHAELSLNGNLIMLGSSKPDAYGKSPKELGGLTGTIYIALDSPSDVDALCARAKRAGAAILSDIHDTDYGSHDFTLRDPEGHVWSFGTYAPQANEAPEHG